MKSMSLLAMILVVTIPMMSSASDETAIEGMQEYLDFANYEAGIILPEQLTEEIFNNVLFVDTRNAGQFDSQSIPGAVNIEWRQVLERRHELPVDRRVVLYCNTGSLSAQATFALRVAGMDNVLVLQTGILGWDKNAAYKPE
jgi:rhodanese-related sulfurtransferase